MARTAGTIPDTLNTFCTLTMLVAVVADQTSGVTRCFMGRNVKRHFACVVVAINGRGSGCVGMQSHAQYSFGGRGNNTIQL